MVGRVVGYLSAVIIVAATCLVASLGDDGSGRAPVTAVVLTDGTAVPVTRVVKPWQPPTATPTRVPIPTPLPGTVVMPTANPNTRAANAEQGPAPVYLVVNTGGEGALLRPEPGSDDWIKGWDDGTEMVVVAPNREAGERIWKNVRDPEGNVGWIAADFLMPVP